MGQPYEFGFSNHAYQLPLIFRTAHPQLYPTDALVATLDEYVAPLYRALGHLERLTGADLQTLYLVLMIMLRLIAVASIGMIVAACVKTVAWWSLATIAASASGWLLAATSAGDCQLLSGFFSHTELASVLGLAAVAMALHERYPMAGVLIGAALWSNPVTTTHVALVMLVWLLVERRLSERPVLISGAIAVASATALLVLVAGEAQPVSETFWQFLPVVYDSHFWIDLPTLLFTLLLGLTVAAVALGLRDRRLSNLMVAALIVTGLLIVANWLGVYVLKSHPIILLHPQRVDEWLHLLVAVGIPVLAARALEDRQFRAVPFLTTALVVQLLDPEPFAAMAAGLSALVLLALTLQGGWRSKGLFADRWLASAVALLLAALVVAASRELTWAAAVVLFGGLLSLLARREDFGMIAGCAVLIVAVASAGTRLAGMQYQWYRTAPSGYYAEVAEWAERNTAVSAEFITPPAFAGWRSGSLRSSFAELRDGSAMIWAPGFEVEWWRRLTALGCAYPVTLPDRPQRVLNRYALLTPAQIVAVSREFGYGDFVVMPADWPFRPALRPEFANGGFVVFSLERLRRQFGAGTSASPALPGDAPEGPEGPLAPCTEPPQSAHDGPE